MKTDIRFDPETLVKSAEGNGIAALSEAEIPTYWRVRALAAEAREVALMQVNAKFQDALNAIAQNAPGGSLEESLAREALGLPWKVKLL